MSLQEGHNKTHNMAKDPRTHKPIPSINPIYSNNESLDQLLHDKYLELFGADHLTEDLPLLTIVNTESEYQSDDKQINRLHGVFTTNSISYQKAMADYKRQRQAEIRKYHFDLDITFPPTMKCVRTALEVRSPTRQKEEDEIEIQLSREDEEEIIVESPEKVPEVSQRQKKREAWANRKRIARRSLREEKQ